ncbi:MAG: hypothetical protein ACLTDS_12275 [Bianqueaceae bacterium]
MRATFPSMAMAPEGQVLTHKVQPRHPAWHSAFTSRPRSCPEQATRTLWDYGISHYNIFGLADTSAASNTLD